jgi:hypothetical protein
MFTVLSKTFRLMPVSSGEFGVGTPSPGFQLFIAFYRFMACRIPTTKKGRQTLSGVAASGFPVSRIINSYLSGQLDFLH